MGKKKSRNRAGRNGSRSTGGSLADALQAALNDSGGEFAESIKEKVEQTAAKREEDKRLRQENERREELKREMRRILVLPHSKGTSKFEVPLQSGFVNPYTFFPLEETKPKKTSTKAGEHSGKLTCTVEVQDWSRLFIPNTSGVFKRQAGKGADKIHKCFEFFSYDDLSKVAEHRTSLPANGPSDPVIPGSELRGMTRSVYEQLTNSCMPIVNEKSNPIKRTNLPKHPYRMEYDEAEGVWKLYETKVLKLGKKHEYLAFKVHEIKDDAVNESDDPYENLKAEYISQYSKDQGFITRKALLCGPTTARGYCTEVHKLDSASMPGKPEYYLHVTGEIDSQGNHNHLLVYPRDRTNNSEALYTFSESSDLFIRFMRVLDAYCEESPIPNHNKVRAIYKTYRALVQHHETVLVYADSTENPQQNLQHLAPSSMSPESFSTRIIDLLSDKGYEPCTGPNFCPACNLFGMVGSKGQLGSRVRFSDAHISKQANGPDFVFDKPVTLAPLSTPRPSATEFYLKRPDGVKDGIWNYDYVLRGKVDSSGNEYLEKDSKPYRKMTGAGISGRKVYVHSPFNLSARYTTDAFVKSTQNVTVRPLKRGTFQFAVFFQDLTSRELATLVYALGGMESGRLQKLGHGRPLGMGSVLVKVTSCETKTYAYHDEQGIITCRKESMKPEWVTENLPMDSDSIARRKIVRYLAWNLLDIPYDDTRKLGDIVSYPKPRDKPIRGRGNIRERNQTFKWFSDNRGTVMHPNFSNVLETLSVERVKDPDSPWQSLPE